MTSLHMRMSRGLSVSLNHKKHTIAAKPCLNRKTDAFCLVDSGPSTQSFSHAQITPTRDFLFRSWWPFPPLLSLISLGDVSCPLPSDLLGKTLGEKRERRKNENKNKEMKREKVIFWRKGGCSNWKRKNIFLKNKCNKKEWKHNLSEKRGHFFNEKVR